MMLSNRMLQNRTEQARIMPFLNEYGYSSCIKNAF